MLWVNRQPEQQERRRPLNDKTVHPSHKVPVNSLTSASMDRQLGMSSDDIDAFLKALPNYTTAIPDALIKHYLSRSGFKTNDPRVERLVAVAAQKFLADVADDALAHARLRQNSMPAPKKASARDTKLTLTVDDLERSLRDYGVNLCKPPYFADSVSAGAPDPPPSSSAMQTTKPPTLPSQPSQQKPK